MPRVVLIVLLTFLLNPFYSLAQDLGVSFDYRGIDSLKVFRSLEAALASDEPVYRLHLKGERLKDFPMEILQLKDLRELQLSNNKIKEIPEEISKLAQLEILLFERNKLTALPSGFWSLSKLRLLALGANDIAAIPDDVAQLQALSHLLLWNNVLGYFSPMLEDLPNLVELDLLNNDMDKTEQAFLREILPEVLIHLSTPCDCDFGE